MSYQIKQSSARKDLSIWIQCTYARAYSIAVNGDMTEIIPNEYDSRAYMCFRSYNRMLCRQGQLNLNSERITNPDSYNSYIASVGLVDKEIKTGQVGELTGNYFIDKKNKIWVEARLLYCDRSKIGWFRERDIWHVEKGCSANPADGGFAPDYYDSDPNYDNNQSAATDKKSAAIKWLTIGLGILSFLK